MSYERALAKQSSKPVKVWGSSYAGGAYEEVGAAGLKLVERLQFRSDHTRENDEHESVFDR